MTPEEDPILKRYLELAFLDNSRDVLLCAKRYCSRKGYTKHENSLGAFLDLNIKPKEFCQMIADFSAIMEEYAELIKRGVPAPDREPD